MYIYGQKLSINNVYKIVNYYKDLICNTLEYSWTMRLTISKSVNLKKVNPIIQEPKE